MNGPNEIDYYRNPGMNAGASTLPRTIGYYRNPGINAGASILPLAQPRHHRQIIAPAFTPGCQATILLLAPFRGLSYVSHEFLEFFPRARVRHVGGGESAAAGLNDAVAHHVEARGAVRVGADDDRHAVALCRCAVQVV